MRKIKNMNEITGLTTILASIKTATDIAKLIKESGISLEKAEIKMKIAELISALADAKIEAAGLQNLISEKDEKIKELEETLNIKKSLRYEAPFYWLDGDKKKDGPYCQACYDSKGKLIHLQLDGAYWFCFVCKQTFYGSSNNSSSTIGNIGVSR